MKSLAQLMNLAGRTALVTGAAGHVGRTIAETLLELGANVIVADLAPDACEHCVTELSRKGSGEAHFVAFDLADEDATRSAVGAALEWRGALDILVHCAAYVGTTRAPGWAAPFDQQTVKAWDEAMRVNLTSAFVLAQESRAALSHSPTGSIIFVSSIYGFLGPDLSLYDGTDMQHPIGYGASKAGLLQLTRSLATTFAPAVRVNAISPGGLFRNQPHAFQARYTQRTPLQRMGTEEDLKGATAFLASDLSAYVTGQNIVVDGGWSIW